MDGWMSGALQRRLTTRACRKASSSLLGRRSKLLRCLATVDGGGERGGVRRESGEKRTRTAAFVKRSFAIGAECRGERGRGQMHEEDDRDVDR